MEKVKIGIVGCGNISPIYFKNCINTFEILEVKACADLLFERAEAKAAEYGIKALTVEEMMNDDEIEIIINLTIPNAHYSVCNTALDAGKSVHTEKPLSILFEEGKALVKKAKGKGLLLGGAPDTFLGAGIQTCRKLIDDGWIGDPIGATAFMLCPGHESWHPSPEFYYKKGGGPMFDMGPYYLTALVNLLGPVDNVAGSVSMTRKQRTITSKPLKGTVMDVEVPTHVTGLLNFKNGAIGTIITSFDVYGGNVPRIEIYGTQGSLSVPDPNGFGGPVKVKIRGNEWADVPLTHIYHENSRGIGVADMAYALRNNRINRCSGELACHVLEIMHGIHIASDNKANYTLETSCARPEPLPTDLLFGRLE